MKKYKVKIRYEEINLEIIAKNKKEAEEYAWFEFDQKQPIEPEISIKALKLFKKEKLEIITDNRPYTKGVK